MIESNLVSEMAIRVYLVEDHPIMRESLVDFLGLNDDLDLVGSSGTAEQAATELEDANPAIVLLDLSLPGRSGLDLLRQIKESWDYPCVVLSGHGERSYLGKALAAGARGYILKGNPAELPGAIRRVLEGEIYLSEGLRHEIEREAGGAGA